jgi:hypothetical protein
MYGVDTYTSIPVFTAEPLYNTSEQMPVEMPGMHTYLAAKIEKALRLLSNAFYKQKDEVRGAFAKAFTAPLPPWGIHNQVKSEKWIFAFTCALIRASLDEKVRASPFSDVIKGAIDAMKGALGHHISHFGPLPGEEDFCGAGGADGADVNEKKQLKVAVKKLEVARKRLEIAKKNGIGVDEAELAVMEAELAVVELE